MADKSRPKSIRALEGRPGAAYDEETFLHLLAIERARADRAGQRLRILLVTIEPVAGKPAAAARVFDGLRELLRETDIMGWYEQTRVVGAVLSAPADEPGFETATLVEQRVESGLKRKLPSTLARSLRVRVTQHGPRRVEQRSRTAAHD
jgi:hypothetical protein